MNVLTIKPTERCNFKCTFCASTHLSDKHSDIVELDKVYAAIDRFPTIKIIQVNGGEPLLMGSAYYLSILEHLQKRERPQVQLQITSNLWPFFKRPEDWRVLFNHPQVLITTSFQYGNGRLKGDLTPFSEEEFWKVSDLMLEIAGYRPDFNTVITEENENTHMATVQLAKRMGVQAKINYADSSGKPKFFKGVRIGNLGNGYLMAKMYQRYIEIYDAGYKDYDDSTLTMTKCLRPEMTTCPLDMDCDAHNRVLQPNGYYSCVSFGDDKVFPINFVKEMNGELARPLKGITDLRYMNPMCPACPLYRVCNGCKKTVKEYRDEGKAETHCKLMKTILPRIIEINQIEAAKDDAELVAY